MHLVDIEGREAVHLVSNLEPKWKPMAEFGKDGLLHELGSVAEAFLALPAIDPEDLRPKGEWQPVYDYFGTSSLYTCSLCGDMVSAGSYVAECSFKYCPHCGAKMEAK